MAFGSAWGALSLKNFRFKNLLEIVQDMGKLNQKKIEYLIREKENGKGTKKFWDSAKEIMKEIKFLKTMHKTHSTGAEYD